MFWTLFTPILTTIATAGVNRVTTELAKRIAGGEREAASKVPVEPNTQTGPFTARVKPLPANQTATIGVADMLLAAGLWNELLPLVVTFLQGNPDFLGSQTSLVLLIASIAMKVLRFKTVRPAV